MRTPWTPEEVELEAQRAEVCDDAAVVCWHLGKNNHAGRANDLAYGIQTLVDSKYQIEDKESGEVRAVEYGDIAVLCRTNIRLQGIASACAKAGIPVAFKRPGLLATPEGGLALACLRRIADGRDTLASAEIRTLAKSESPEDWLEDRISFFQEEESSHAWGETGSNALPILKALAEVRSQSSLLTPSEALELALGEGEVREAAISWGPTANHTRHRLRNVDLLLEYAANYEDQCDMLNLAATVPGLILWLNDLAARGEDWQAEAADGRAVTLVTHHGAKGLEWPVVVAVDLDADIRGRLWGLTVLQREEGFDMMDPLAGRQLRYWPWPFGMQSTGIPLADRIAASPVGEIAQISAIEEIQRLLYVSLTRARDCLIVPLPARKPTGEWLETLGADWMLPEGAGLTLPNGTSIPTAFAEITAPDDWATEPEDNDGSTILHMAAVRGNITVLRYICDTYPDMIHDTDNNKRNAAHYAAQYGTVECLKFLIEQGINPRDKDTDGSTILHRAAIGGNITVLRYICDTYPDMIHDTNNNKRNAAHLAAQMVQWNV